MTNTLDNYVKETEKSRLDREYLIRGVNSDNKEISKKYSDFIIDNLVRYLSEGKTLSNEGYFELNKHFTTVLENTSYSDHKSDIATSFLMREGKRIQKEKEKINLAYLRQEESNIFVKPIQQVQQVLVEKKESRIGKWFKKASEVVSQKYSNLAYAVSPK